MTPDDIVVSLTPAEALVLFDLLSRVGTSEPAGLVEHESERRVLDGLLCSLEEKMTRSRATTTPACPTRAEPSSGRMTGVMGSVSFAAHTEHRETGAATDQEVTVSELPILVCRPSTLSLTWTEQSRRTFPYLDLVARRWDAWLATNTPTDEQMYRKVLLDVWVTYRAANHQGASMASEGQSWAAEFNACTGKPLTSTRDYVERVWPLVSKLMSARGPWCPEDTANAMFMFLIHGSPEAKP